MSAPLRVRLLFEWGGGCIWCGNDRARQKFGVGPIEDLLPLSSSCRSRLSELSKVHDGALNWQSPADPSPWSEEQFAEFDFSASELVVELQSELGPEFEVVYERLG